MPLLYLGFFDPLYLVLLLPGLLIAAWAQAKVRGAFARYERVTTRARLTGAEVARMILKANGQSDVEVERIGGLLSDHYDPTRKVVRLSPQVYDSPSVAALGVAAHETGHALQHADNYAPLQLRTALVPAVQFGSNLAWIFLLGGVVLATVTGAVGLGKLAILTGIALFSVAVVFSLVTLPVEINASQRALALLTHTGVLTTEEGVGARDVLRAAAYTYVAAALVAILQLLYYVIRFLPFLSSDE
ncbi:MAG: zinc metallopeptidase [Planctomycetota bacterium]